MAQTYTHQQITGKAPTNTGRAPRYDMGEGALYNADGSIHYDRTFLDKAIPWISGGILAGIGGAGLGAALGGGAAAGAAAGSGVPGLGVTAGLPAGAAIGAGAAGGGMSAGVIAPLVSSGVQSLFGFFGNRSANQSADRSAQYQAQAAKYAADIQAKAQAEQLAFLKEQETARQREWQMTQDRNRAIYDAEQGRDDQRYNDLQARMQPYRQFGAGAIGQFKTPIGSLGQRMGA